MGKIEATQKIILFINIGATTTRVALFEMQYDIYNFIGSVSSHTIYDQNGEIDYESVSTTIRKLERITGRSFLDDNDRVIVPQKLDRIGADQIAVTYSKIEVPRIFLMGLSEDFSMHELRNLLRNSGSKEVGSVCAMEGKSLTANVDEIINADPDIIVIGGGTENGAERAVYRLGEILLLACKSMSAETKPRILFLGNSAARAQFQRVFLDIGKFSVGEGILSTRNADKLSPVQSFGNVIYDYTKEHCPALVKLSSYIDTRPITSEFAFGRAIRLMSRLTRQNRSVLGIDVGAGNTKVAFSSNMELSMNVSDIGMGSQIHHILDHFPLSEMLQWIPFQMKDSEFLDYVWNKSVHPELVPGNDFSVETELAVARFIMRHAVSENAENQMMKSGELGMVFLSGSILRNVSDPSDTLRAAMDGLRPLGEVDYFLDLNSLAPAIGAFAEINRSLAAQITAHTLFLHLGKVITPVTSEKRGKVIMKVLIRDDSGQTLKHDLIQGGIRRIPLEYGKNYELTWLHFSKGTSVPGIHQGDVTKFKSGCFGLVFDLRGNEILFPKERTAQIHLLDRWKNELGSWKKG